MRIVLSIPSGPPCEKDDVVLQLTSLTTMTMMTAFEIACCSYCYCCCYAAIDVTIAKSDGDEAIVAFSWKTNSKLLTA